MIKLSFIVPVYNVEKYLRKCVDSLLAQDYDDYEIILVDDGSTDNSPQICDEYAASSLSAVGTSPFSEADHSIIPIRVIHQANAGLSAARNAGIKCAEGKYLCFVDSDDYWEPNVLGRLMSQIEKEHLDVLRFDYQNVNENYEVFNPNKSPRYIDKESSVVDGITYLNTRMGYACYAVMFILRRDLIIPSLHHSINPSFTPVLFTEGIHFEDVDWLPRMMLRAKRVNSSQTIVYNYLVRQGSITKTQGNVEKLRKNMEDQMTVMQNLTGLVALHPNCNWLTTMRSSMAVSVLTNVALHFYDERDVYLNQLQQLQIYPLHPISMKARLINLAPRLFVELLHIKNH